MQVLRRLIHTHTLIRFDVPFVRLFVLSSPPFSISSAQQCVYYLLHVLKTAAHIIDCRNGEIHITLMAMKSKQYFPFLFTRIDDIFFLSFRLFSFVLIIKLFNLPTNGMAAADVQVDTPGGGFILYLQNEISRHLT